MVVEEVDVVDCEPVGAELEVIDAEILPSTKICLRARGDEGNRRA